MKLFVVLCFVAAACAAPPFEDAKIIRYDNDNIGTGNYGFNVEQSDGTQQFVVGELKNNQAYAVKGSYSWNAPDGIKYTVTYTADELGYRSSIDKQGAPNAKIIPLVL